MLRERLEEAGLVWEECAVLVADVYHAPDTLFTTRRLHTRRSCAERHALNSTNHLRRHRFSLPPQPRSASTRLGAIEHGGRAPLCGACGGVNDLLVVTKVRSVGRDLRSVVDDAASVRRLTEWFAERAPDVAGAYTWRKNAEALAAKAAAVAAAFPDGPTSARYLDVAGGAEDLHERLQAVLRGDQTLETWAQRWAVGERYRGAPVPATALAGPLGGIRAVEGEFRQWCTSDPATLVRQEGYEELYAYWGQLCESAHHDRGALVALHRSADRHNPSGGRAGDADLAMRARFDGATLRLDADYRRANFPGQHGGFSGSVLSVHAVTGPVSRLLAALAATCGWGVTTARAPGRLPGAAAELATELIESGVPVDEALRAAVNAVA